MEMGKGTTEEDLNKGIMEMGKGTTEESKGTTEEDLNREITKRAREQWKRVSTRE